MYRQIIQENGQELTGKFNKLKTIEQKFDFWLDELKRLYDVDNFINHPEVEPFRIIPKSNIEIEAINCLCYQRFIEGQEVETFENLKESFSYQYDSAENKTRYVELEKRNIEKLVDEKKTSKSNFDRIMNNSFLEAYYDYYIYSKHLDLSKEVRSIKELSALNNGYLIGRYHNYIDSLLKKTKEPKSVYSHIQQMLILDYLELGKDLTNIKRAEFYSKIIRRDFETTRQYLSELEIHRNKRNVITPLKDFFFEYGLSEKGEKVENDIKKIK